MNYRITKSFRYYLALLTIFIVPLWAPINKWIIRIDGAGRVPLFMLLITMLLLGDKTQSVLFKRPVLYYLCFAIFVFINGILKQSYLTFEDASIYLIFYWLFTPIMYMVIIAVALKMSFSVTLKWLTLSFFVYCLLCCFWGTMQDTGRLGGDINSNSMALYGVFCFFCLLLQYICNYRSFFSLLLFSLVPVLLIVFTGSRTAFVILLIVAFLSVPFFYKKGDIKTFLMIFGATVSIVIGGLYVINHTVLGERLMTSTTQMEDHSFATGTILDKFGDRGIQYYLSWPYFKQHPFGGLGLNNWRRVSGQPYVFHSEWLVQYCENGLCGLFLYLLFYISLLHRMTVSQKFDGAREVKIRGVVKYILYSIFLLNFVSWTYDSYCVFAFYAVAVRLSNKKCFISYGKAIRFHVLSKHRWRAFKLSQSCRHSGADEFLGPNIR